MKDQPKKPRRQRVDSPAGVADAIIAGGKRITPPSDISFDGKEGVIFSELCDEFSKTELTPHKTRLVAILAKDVAALDREMEQLRREGSVLTNSHGNEVANPRTKVVQNLSNTILSMRRSLAIHTRALEGGSLQKAAVRRAHNKSNEAARDNYHDDNLIRFPGGDHDGE